MTRLRRVKRRRRDGESHVPDEVRRALRTCCCWPFSAAGDGEGEDGSLLFSPPSERPDDRRLLLLMLERKDAVLLLIRW